MADAAEITPAELKFKFQLNKQLPAAISIHNPTSERLAFKVKTTTPRKYVVRPSSGVVEARSTANVQVIMQAQKEIPADFAQCKDKFLVQVKGLEAGEEVNQDTFKGGVKDTKIRVLLEGPPAPPSPVPEVNEQEDDGMARGTSGAGTTVDGFSSAVTASAGGDAAGQENRALRVQLERVMKERDQLRSQLDKAGKGTTAGGSSSTKTMAPMSLLPVLIVGLLAFLVGHYLQNIPVISNMVRKH